MNLVNTIHSKITNEHRAKFAYVYLRQSSPGQLLHNTESTARQYALVERAVHLGWPRDRVRLIDEDLGRSRASTDTRHGFQQLIAEIGLRHVGLVIALEADRLSRNNGDWYRLLELCSIFDTLIADAEMVYDPRLYHDRLLLGLAGMMSEANSTTSRCASTTANSPRQREASSALRCRLASSVSPQVKSRFILTRRFKRASSSSSRNSASWGAHGR